MAQIEVKIIDKTPDEILSLVKQLRQQGLVQGKDFDFSYHQAKYNNDGWSAVENRHAKFVFSDEKFATLFTLRFT